MLLREFKDLSRKKDRRIGMPDLLNYAFLGAPVWLSSRTAR